MKCSHIGPDVQSPGLANRKWNETQNNLNENHPCLNCKDFIPDKKVRIGLCKIYNKIIHRDKKKCKIKEKK